MNLDYLVGELADQVALKLEPRVERAAEAAIRRVMAEKSEPAIEPLHRILGISVAAARMRLSRDADLRALGLPIGRRLAFRSTEVMALLESRARAGNGASRTEVRP